jgi:F-type H+-transporting ATPase subunit delta
MSHSLIKVAERYASALIEASGKHANQITTDLEQLHLSLLNGAQYYLDLLNSPVHNHTERTKCIDAIQKQLKLHKYVASLLRLLAANRRLNLLSMIIERYLYLKHKLNNEYVALVTSVTKLTKTQATQVQKSLEKESGKKILVENIVDPSILGGLIIQLESLVIDNSIRSKLNKIKLLSLEDQR